jgi:hypothetical protein
MKSKFKKREKECGSIKARRRKRKRHTDVGPNKSQVRAIKSHLVIIKGLHPFVLQLCYLPTTLHFATFQKTLNLMFTRYENLKSKILISSR